MRATAEGRPTVGKKPAKVCVNAGFADADWHHSPPGPFSSKLRGYEQELEGTDAQRWSGRYVLVSQPTLSETVSFGRIGKSRACAAKVSRFIQGRLHACVRD